MNFTAKQPAAIFVVVAMTHTNTKYCRTSEMESMLQTIVLRPNYHVIVKYCSVSSQLQ